MSLAFPLAPFRSHAAGEGLGVRAAPHLPLPLPPGGSVGGMRGAGAILRLSKSPLSRSAGEGLGVRAIRSAGEGLGVRAAPHLPLPLPPGGSVGGKSGAGAILRLSRSPLSRSAGEGLGVRAIRSAGEGLGVRSTPLPQRGSGAGGEEHPSPAARERGWG